MSADEATTSEPTTPDAGPSGSGRAEPGDSAARGDDTDAARTRTGADAEREDETSSAGQTVAAAGAIVAAAITGTVAAAAPAAATPVTTAAAVARTPTAVTKKAKAESPGATKLAQLCGDSDAAICQQPKWSEDHLTFDAVVIGRYVDANWPQIKIVGGWRPSDPYPDHPSGRAVDVMMPNSGQGKDKALGDEIARYFQDHAKEYGIEYMLWHQQQWQVGDKPGKWSPMSDRGSPTANHMDHVHITVKGDKNTMVEQLMAESAAPVEPVAPPSADKTRATIAEIVIKRGFPEP